MASKSQHVMSFILNAQQNAGFQAVFSKAQQEVSRLGKEIKDLERLQGQVSGYQTQQSAIQKTEEKLQRLTQRQALVKEQMQSASAEALPELKEKYLKLEQQVSDTTSALERQNQKLAVSRTRLAEAGVDTAGLAAKNGELSAKLEELRKQQDKAAEGARTFGEKAAAGFSAAGDALAAAGILEALGLIADQTAKNARAAP